MLLYINPLIKIFTVLLASVFSVSCVTETINSPNSMRFSNTSIISVQDPNAFVSVGSTFAWLPEAVHFYKDERLGNAPIKSLIEKEIVKNMLAKGLVLVESENTAKFAIAYTAALESSLDDNAIIQRFGLSLGHAQVPQDDTNIEKGSLIIYLFDNRTNDVVWRSAAQDTVKFDASIADRQKNLQRIIAEMFQAFAVSE